MNNTETLTVVALADFPLVEPGDDLVTMIVQALKNTLHQGGALDLQAGDVLVVAQKIVSKAEGCYRSLDSVEPSAQAVELAGQVEKDPRLVELILSESQEVVRHRPGVLIVEHKNGYVHANAGIDQSNIQSEGRCGQVLLLPEDPDASANTLRSRLHQQTGVAVPVIINDSAGRAWRNGTVGMAIGTAGFEPLQDLIGQPDLFGRPMAVTEVAVADELAAAASFVMGQAAEACPVVLIRGANVAVSDTGSGRLLRAKEQDLFR